MTMARRILSIAFFTIGGFCVGMQVMIAFVEGYGPADYIGRTLYFSAIAALFLAAGTAVSPGRRWRELGLTILIGAAVCVGSFSTVIFLPDEQGVTMDGKELQPYLAMGPGFTNLALLVVLGVLLYVRGGSGSPTLIGRLARSGVANLAFTLRASLQGLRRK